MINMIMKSNQTLTEMLFDRTEYKWSDELKNINTNNLIETVSQKQQFHFDIVKDNRLLKIIYALQPKFKLSDIKKFIETDYDFCFIIIKDKTSLLNVRTIEHNTNTQIFHLKELQYNITKHELVPKHELITKEQTIYDILNDLNIKSRFQLPLILKSDPVARYLNAKTGHLLKIYRSSPSCVIHIFYRCCL